jgi:hypothetical protein
MPARLDRVKVEKRLGTNPTLRIAVKTVDITPIRPVGLGGFAGRLGPYRLVADDLALTVLVLRQVDAVVAIVSADVLFFDDAMREGLLRRLRDGGLTLTADQLILAATHTHFAPMLDATKPRLGIAEREYRERIEDKAYGVLRELLEQDGEAVSLRYSRGAMRGQVCRRSLRATLADGGVVYHSVMAPNAAEPVDDALTVIRFDTYDGRPKAIVWNWACHPVGFPELEAVSADFPGTVRRRIKAEFGPQIEVLFLQGCAGDIRPDTTPAGGARDAVPPTDRDIEFSPFTPDGWERWAAAIADGVLRQVLATNGWIQIAPAIASSSCSIRLDRVASEAGDTMMGMRLLMLARDLAIVCWSAEPVSGYAVRLRSLLPECTVIAAGYVDTVFGYLPTDRMVRFGGYEVGGFCEYFGWPGRFTEAVEDVVMAAFAELARSAGLKLVADDPASSADAVCTAARRNEWSYVVLDQLRAKCRAFETAAVEWERLRDELAAVQMSLANSEQENASLRHQHANFELENASLRRQLDGMLSSTSWRITAPLRRAMRLLRAPAGIS